MNAGTVLALGGAGPAGQRARRRGQPGRRGDDADRRARRLRDGAAHRQRCSGVRGRRRRGRAARGAVRLLVIWLGTNQYATGLALSLFGVGFSAFAGGALRRQAAPRARPRPGFPGCATCRSSGRRCSATTRWSTSRPRWRRRSPGSSSARAPGLVLRAVGESPESAHALGLAGARGCGWPRVIFGGAMCGLAGAYVSIVYTTCGSRA